MVLIAGILTYNQLRQPQIRIEWNTQSELDVIGFNLYRASKASGPFVRINSSLVPPSPDPFVGGQHAYVDSDVRWGTSYFYQLETIDRLGHTTRSAPIELRAGLIPLTP